jgi:hypothetical protein
MSAKPVLIRQAGSQLPSGVLTSASRYPTTLSVLMPPRAVVSVAHLQHEVHHPIAVQIGRQDLGDLIGSVGAGAQRD